MRPMTVAIDGPAASGKSTVGEALAKQLGYLYFDTGVMYRAVTWAALARDIDIEDEETVTALAERLEIEVTDPTDDDGRQYTVLADGIDVTWAIRRAEIDANVSAVSAYRGVRHALVAKQRRIAAGKAVIMVGRDIGTVVLPDADLKIYLDATVEERARRRWLEKWERGKETDREAVLDAMRRRDRIDSNREISPLCAAEDAIRIDTTQMSIERVVEEAVRLVQDQDCP